MTTSEALSRFNIFRYAFPDSKCRFFMITKKSNIKACKNTGEKLSRVCFFSATVLSKAYRNSCLKKSFLSVTY